MSSFTSSRSTHTSISADLIPKLYIDTGTDYDIPFGHPFSGYFLTYPETRYSGLISSISDDPPIMNWIYVDRATHEVKFGGRVAAEPQMHGPFDVTRQDRRLTFGGWEGWLAVKEGDFWALYFDRDGDRLVSKVKEGTPVLDIELWRREIRGGPRVVEKKEAAVENDAGAAAATASAAIAGNTNSAGAEAIMTDPDID